MRRGRIDWVAVGVCALGAIGVALGILWRQSVEDRVGLPSHDIYGYSVPIFRYAQAALQQGHGLLWDPLHNNGQPFLAIPSVALFYPPNFLALPFSDRHWLIGQALFHILIAGAGSYWLARELGLGRAEAAASAIAMQLGGTLIELAAWFPQALATYAWMPCVVALGERVLRRPTPAAVVALATALSLQILAGYPQIAVFSYEILALRLLVHLAFPIAGRLAAARSLLIAMALPLGLAAVQLLPASEMLAGSVRNVGMTPDELRLVPISPARFEAFRERGLGPHSRIWSVVAGALALAALAIGHRRRAVWFFAGLGALSLVLVFDSPLLRAYQALPVVGNLRGPSRFLWITAFAATALVGFGVAALSDLRSRALAAALYTAELILFHAWSSGIAAWEWALALTPLVAVFFAGTSRREWVPLSLCVALALSLAVQNRHSAARWLPDDTRVWTGRPAFDFIAQAAPGRVLPLPSRRGIFSDKALHNKIPGLYGLPAITDYEHLTSRRHADVFVRMAGQRDLDSVSNWFRAVSNAPTEQTLFDLLGTRWVVTHGRRPPTSIALSHAWQDGAWAVHENPGAYPRAFFAPKAIVIGDRRARVEALVDPELDLRRTVVLESAPSDGFLGTTAAAATSVVGSVSLVSDRSEQLSFDVQAPTPGFVVVTDQHYDGWQATVDGVATPVLRANHAFRAVRVPAGSTRLEFEYRPWRLVAGAGVSLLSSLGCGGWLWHSRGQSRAAEGA